MAEMARRQILPAAAEFAGKMAAVYTNLSAAGIKNEEIRSLAARLSELISEVSASSARLEDALQRCETVSSLPENAALHRDEIRAVMQQLRQSADAMEQLVSSAGWPIPTYTDLLYRV